MQEKILDTIEKIQSGHFHPADKLRFNAENGVSIWELSKHFIVADPADIAREIWQLVAEGRLKEIHHEDFISFSIL